MLLQDPAEDPRQRADGYDEIAKELLGLAARAVTEVAREQFAVLAALYESLARQARAHLNLPRAGAEPPERAQ